MSDNDWPHRVRMFFFGEKRFYRDVWLVFVTIAVGFALLSFKQTQDDQIQGRKNATETTCAVNSAIMAAGQEVLTQSAGKELANTYASTVSSQVEKQTGVADLINPKTGEFDCEKLKKIVRVDP